MPTPQCITISSALAKPRHFRSSTHCSRIPSAVPRHPACTSAMAPFRGTARYTGIQSATVTVSSTPSSRVAWPSLPSRMSQPSGTDSCQCTSVPCPWCASTMDGKRAANVARNAGQRPLTCPTGSSLHKPGLRHARARGKDRDEARGHAVHLVHEDKPRLEQLLEYEQRPFALGRADDRDGHGVRRKRGPRAVLELRDVTAEIGTDAALLAGVDD